MTTTETALLRGVATNGQQGTDTGTGRFLPKDVSPYETVDPLEGSMTVTEGNENALDALELVRLLGSKYSAEILGATREPRSAKELSEELDIPIATSYRRINALNESDLLERTDSVLTDERKRMDVYRCNVERLVVEFSESGPSVTVEERTEVKNKLDDVWRTLSDPDT